MYLIAVLGGASKGYNNSSTVIYANFSVPLKFSNFQYLICILRG